MNPVDLQRDVRSAISMAYELSRHEHVQQKVHIAAALADLEFELTRIEAKLGGPRLREIAPGSLSGYVSEVSEVVADAGTVVGAQITALLMSVRDIQRRLASSLSRRGVTPAKVALGAGVVSALVYASTRRSKAAGAAIGLGAVGALAGAFVVASLVRASTSK